MTAITETDIKELKDLLTAFREDMKRVEIGQAEIKGDLKALEATISGLAKRVDNQEFTNRGILIALIVAIVGSVAKLLGWVGTP